MKKITISVFFFLIGILVNAKDVSQSQAMKIAQNFLANHNKTAVVASRSEASKLDLAYIANAIDGQKCIYIFNVNANDGFILVSADDMSEKILGYSDNGSFDYTQIPDNMKSWLAAYTDQITHIRKSNIQNTATFDYSYTKTVAPLLEDIQWNQSTPYNDLCPVYDISSRCATGCVATAMAQIMYYNRWPENGVGSYTYSPSILGGKTLTADFGNTTYAWDDMLPQYDKQSSKASCEAVALLMLHCGISVDMEYSSSSGAGSLPIPNAFVKYFNYDKSIAYRTRENYSSAEWQNTIIDELDNSRPILALGRSSSGGHAFVFDGYDSNGFIHVNWGWGGMSNGYFRTTALTPPTQGIGGADGGFNYNQYIITNIQKPFPDSTEDIELVSSEGLVPNKNQIAANDLFSLTLNGTLRNAGWQSITVNFGLALLNEDGETVKIISEEDANLIELEYLYSGLLYENISLGSLPDGNYKLYPVSRIDGSNGKWHRVRDEYVGYPNYLNVNTQGETITFAFPDYFCLNASAVKAPTEIHSGIMTSVQACIVNEGDVNYLGEVRLAIVDKKTGRSVAYGSTIKIDLCPGNDTNIVFTDIFTLAKGEYLLTIVDDDNRHICNSRSIHILEAPADDLVIEAVEQLTFADNSHVDKNNLSLTAKIRCSKGVFGGYAYLYILNENATIIRTCLNPQFFTAKEGETVEVPFSGEFENGVEGTTYQAVILLYDGTQYISLAPRSLASCFFTLDNSTGIHSIDLDDETAGEIMIFNTMGIRMSHNDINSLPSGVYIIKSGDRTYKITK